MNEVMMMRRIGMMCAVAGVLASGVMVGQAPVTVSTGPASEVQANYGRIKPNVLKAAEKMGAEDYGYKPTKDVRTFARVVNHVTEAQLHSCGALIGAGSAETIKVPAETAGKAEILAALKASFDVCDKAYAGVTEANAAEMVQVGPAKRSRVGVLWGNVSHDNEQYATLALYLRLKGLVPPSSEK